MGVSSHRIPRFTVIASTDHGDFPRYTDDADMIAVLVAEARRSGAFVIIEDRQHEIARGDEIDEFLALIHA